MEFVAVEFGKCDVVLMRSALAGSRRSFGVNKAFVTICHVLKDIPHVDIFHINGSVQLHTYARKAQKEQILDCLMAGLQNGGSLLSPPHCHHFLTEYSMQR